MLVVADHRSGAACPAVLGISLFFVVLGRPFATRREAVERYISEFSLDQRTRVVEIASNDGYLLQNFRHVNIPCLGVEPAANIAKVAREKGIETIVEFFGESLANRLASAG